MAVRLTMPQKLHSEKKRQLNAMDRDRSPWFSHWQTISDYYLPRRYPYLLGNSSIQRKISYNSKLLTSVSTMAVRTLANGLMNGVTSPARPWFRLRIAGFDEESLSMEVKIYLEEVTRRLLLILAESNFYNAMAILYLEWCTFGTAAMTIYEDFDDVLRFYNHALGEFYISQDDTARVNRFSRRFQLTVENLVAKFGLENVAVAHQQKFQANGEGLFDKVTVHHVVEPNTPEDGLIPANVAYREIYWDPTDNVGNILAISPLHEWNAICPRWELLSGETYGVSPAMDALADVKELQHTLYERKQALEKQISPPLLVDSMLMGRPTALAAKGMTFVPNLGNTAGARAAYDTRAPLQELGFDVQSLTTRIQETCFNPLFNMISQLDTVRSSNEIDALREEKLVGLGPVLERFHHNLSAILKRSFGVAERAGLLPDRPEDLDGVDLQIQYISILSDAQRSVGLTSTERFLAFTGNLAGVYPDIVGIPNVEELTRDYAEKVGVKATGLNSREQVAETQAAQEQAAQMAQAASVGNDLAQGAKTLSDTDVGGGANALQTMVG